MTEKEQLLSKLLESVKGCQSRFGSRTELATEGDETINKLCLAFEDVFLHGVKEQESKKSLWQITENLVPAGLRLPLTETPSFWPLIKSQLSKHEAERFLLLHKVRTDYGRGRAWLRAALNEHSLERYIHIFLSLDNLTNYYDKSAFLLDPELSQILPQTAAGLGSVLFALVVDNPVLDCWVRNTGSKEDVVASPVEVAEVADQFLAASYSPPDAKDSISESQRHRRKKKKPHVNVVSFDDDNNPSSTSQKTSFQSQSSSNTTTPTPTVTPIPTLPGMEQVSKLSVQSPDDDSQIPEISIYSSSVKSVDCISIYSDCSERLEIDSQDLGRISPSQRLKPCHDHEVSDDCSSADLNLIPLPNFNPEDVSSPPELKIDVDFTSPSTPSAATPTTPVIQCSPSEEERIVKLKAILDREIENVANLQSQLAEEKRKSRDSIKILEARVEALTKDNEILRHQLNKYIGAVQLLKKRAGMVRRGSSFEDDEGIDKILKQVEETQSLSGQTASSSEDSEGAEYERKLIQVAEMHGELMEFNAHLQSTLRKRDVVIRRLREELVDLRGPLGSGFGDDGPFDEGSWDIVDSTSGDSTTSPNRSRHIQLTPGNERVLINIWIPSAFLTGAATDLHHVYQVFIRIKDTEWNVYRRYSQFYNLHKELKKNDTVLGTFYFPPKKHVGNKDGKFVEERRRKLQDYLRNVINHTLQTNSILAAHPDKNLLISIFPFFGEHAFPHQHHHPKKERSKRSLFFRSPQNHNSPSGFTTAQVPQYTGL